MANEEHLEILRQGVEVWYRWREKNPDVLPDLSGANLYEANLRGADLSRSDLTEAILIETDLSGADLMEADLSGADLSGANLNGALLIHADLSRAIVGYTVFADLDLRAVKGLETIHHHEPSTIGIDTIYRSRGQIPEAFLRGCGVPDTFIAYITSLPFEVMPYYSCFISYSSKDDAFAQRLHADLQGNNVRCWFAPEDMKIGDEIRSRIQESIKGHDKLLLVLSEHSINSTWVKTEVETAFEEESKRNKTVLFPIRLDETAMETDQAWAADIRRTRHIGDFRRWKDHDSYQQAFDRLLHDLKASEA
jgi:uncharacterized protein YjbI with pentapeptide repeats